MKVLLLFLISAYRAAKPLLPAQPRCRHWPSCSAYGEEALARHGARKGLRLILNRLARCRPWGTGGFDPVPENP